MERPAAVLDEAEEVAAMERNNGADGGARDGSPFRAPDGRPNGPQRPLYTRPNVEQDPYRVPGIPGLPGMSSPMGAMPPLPAIGDPLDAIAPTRPFPPQRMPVGSVPLEGQDATTIGGPPTPARRMFGSLLGMSNGDRGASQPGPQSRPQMEGANVPGPRQPTLTARMRAVQPPDVARQAISELGVLARELATLPELIASSGLARTHTETYFEATQGYVSLARQAWESVAEERLEQSGADPEYRQRAILVARRVSQLQQDCQRARENEDFQLPRRRPLMWRRRVELVRLGLRGWQDRLAPTPDAQLMGRGLLTLRGSLGLAVAGGVELWLLDMLMGAVAGFLGLLSLGIVLSLVGALVSGDAVSATGAGLSVVGYALVWAVLLALGRAGPAPLGMLLGASVFSPMRSTRNGRSGSPAVALLLRIWWLVVGIAAIPLYGLALLAGSQLVINNGLLVAPRSLAESLALAADFLTLAFAPAAIVALLALLLLALPVLAAAALRFTAEVASGPAWVPAARRYALAPALTVLAPLAVLFAIGVWVAASALGWQHVEVLRLVVGATQGVLTWRGIVVLLALTLPYLGLLEVPYRVGMLRWRRAWIDDLTMRRADVESHVRRLSVADPRSGTQDTSEETLRAMQYDLVLLQFYRDKMREAERAVSAPFPLVRVGVALVLVFVAVLVVESVALALGPVQILLH